VVHGTVVATKQALQKRNDALIWLPEKEEGEVTAPLIEIRGILGITREIAAPIS
jgi:hypothetical protein